MIYERHHFGDSKSLSLSFYELLFEPGFQLMHVDKTPWTEVEAQAVIGLKILRVLESVNPWESYESNWLAKLVFEEGLARVEFLESARRLIILLGYDERVLASIARLLAHVHRRFTLKDGSWQCADLALSVYFRLIDRVYREFGGFVLRLADFLYRNAGQLRGDRSSRLQLARCCFWPDQSIKPRQALCMDWSAGDCFQAVFLQLPNSVVKAWSDRPEVRLFSKDGECCEELEHDRYGHLAMLADSTATHLLDPGNLATVGAQVDWAVLNCGFLHARLVCQSKERFDELLADAERQGAEVLLQHRGLANHGVARHAISFFESRHPPLPFDPPNAAPIGMPAVIAARHEGVMPWLLLNVSGLPTLWFLEATAEWECFGIEQGDLLCKPRSESAILAAFSRLGSRDNIACGAISGRIDEAQLRQLLQLTSDWGTDAVLQRARLAPWAYGHQWGGGCDEHFSIFCAQDLVLSGLIADHLGKGNFSWL